MKKAIGALVGAVVLGLVVATVMFTGNAPAQNDLGQGPVVTPSVSIWGTNTASRFKIGGTAYTGTAAQLNDAVTATASGVTKTSTFYTVNAAASTGAFSVITNVVIVTKGGISSWTTNGVSI